MDDETSDILGQQTKPILRANKNDNWLTISLAVRVAFAFTILLVLYVGIMRIWFRILVWKERSYKLAMRRRHGIPDNDHRPFNVAYAAVLRARQEKEAAQKAKATQSVPLHDRRNAQIGQNVRQRFGLQTAAEAPRASSYSSRFPGAFFAEGTPARSYSEIRQTATVDPSGSASGRYESGAFNGRRTSRKDLDMGTGAGGQKRGFAEERPTEEGMTKRSRRENEFTGNESDPEDAAFQVEEPPQRVAKRYLFDEDDDEDDLTERQPRDKRARKVSLEKGIQAQEDGLEDMDIDEELEDEVDDLPSVQRGKKRDRVEAGSTFGGDDDESGPERDADLKSKRRRRKPSTVGKGKSILALPTRGHKRDRDLGEDESEIESDDETPHVSRKKRGKRAYLHDDEISEHSTARSQTSSGSRNRKIGEEWYSNGIRWKLGPNGQRLRQALVRKTRQRFPMPEDSQHPDRQADFEVYVETWLNEEEYREAKVHHLLAGQDTPKRSESKLAVDVQTHTSGKNLLWSATSTPVDSPASYSPISDRGLPANQRVVRTSLISSSSPRSNPFDQLPTHNMRRISSITRTASVGNLGSPGLADTTNSNPHGRFKTYSKFEKQELEAQALLRLRELKNRKEAEINQAKVEQAAKDKENFDKAIAPATIPSITVTAPTDAPKQIAQPTPSLFNPSHSAEDTSKSTDAPKSQPLFGFPSTSTPSQPSAAVMSPMVPKSFVGGATPNTLPFPPAGPAPATLKPDDKPPQSSSAPPSSISFGPSLAPSSGTGMTQPTINPFAPATTAPVAATASTIDQARKPSFSFNFPSSNPATARASTGSAAPDSIANSTTSGPVFSFGFGSSAPKPTAEQKTPEATSQPVNGNSALLGRLGPPTTTATSSAPPQSSPFNFVKPTADTSTPNSFSTPASQPAQATSNAAASNTSTQPKFNFGFGNSASTSSNSATNNAATPATASSTAPSNPFVSTTHSGPMVSFTPLTPNGGTGVDKLTTGGSVVSKAAPDPSSFGFKVPATSSTSSAFGSAASKGAPTSGLGAPNPFNTNGSNTSNVFGSTVFGTKPTENTAANLSGTSQANKGLFSFGVAGGPPSSSNASGPQSSDVFGKATAPKPAATSSSLFGALGSQPANTFGSVSNFGATSNAFGSSNTTSSSRFGPTTANAFGSQPNQAGSSGQPSTNIFGSAGAATSNPFGSTKPAEAPKSAFSLAPTTNGTTSTSVAPDLPTAPFQFNNPTQNNTGSSSGVPTSTTATSTAPKFVFNFGGDKSSAPSKPPQQLAFGAPSTPGTQSTTEPKPNPFNFSSPFTSNGPSATGSIFASSEQK